MKNDAILLFRPDRQPKGGAVGTQPQSYQRFHPLVALQDTSQCREFCGVVKVVESYFGPSRVRGRLLPRLRGRDRLKQPVFSIFERQGEMYTEIIQNYSQTALRVVICGRIDPASIVCSDSWPGYDGLVDVGYDKHIRINK